MTQQYTGHGANTRGLQAHSIGESYPYIVVGIDNPRQGKETRWRVVNAITGEVTFYDFLRVEKAHAVAERAAAGCAVALSLFR